MPTFRIRSAFWTRTVLAATLILCLMASTVQAAAAPVSIPAQAKALTTENVAAFLKQFFSSEEVKAQLAGATVIVVKDGKTVIEEGFGYADKAGKTAVDPDETVFRMASVSKTFTAAAAMQLVEQGKIDLKADFQTYTGPLNFDNPFGTPVTVEQLLTHTTGFRIQDPQPEDINDDFKTKVSIEDYVKQHIPPVVREPGTSYMYDNFASLLLGLVVEKASGEPYEDYMEKHVFAPLNMDKSGFLLEGELKEDLATAYDATGKALDLYTVTPTVMPHGGMLSTADDIGKFMTAFLDGGAAGNNRILAESSVEAMEQYRSSIHPLLPNTTYGFEAPIQLPGAGSSSKIITKAGDLIGFSSYMFLIPEQNTGVFIGYNQQSALRELFYPAFIQEFFPQYAAPAKLDAFQPLSAEALDAFTGYYADLRLKSLVSTVAVNGGALSITDALLGTRQLRQVDDNLFIDELTKKFTAFELDADGQGTYLKEPYLNPYGYEQKGPDGVGYADVTANHAYAAPVMMLQSLGYLPNDAALSFQPEAGITRAEYVRLMLESSGLKGSKTEKLAFPDLQGHPDAAFVQMAVEIGMIQGTAGGEFQPDRVISRQEAAVMIWRLLNAQYPDKLFTNVKLAGNTDKWAIPAVKMAVALGLYGPEIKADAKGKVDFKSRAALSKQENAAILYALFTNPMNQIVAKLMEKS
ncbi:penicillin-binding protein [Paenibacillus donghaensis]|uniref:Penicillin-binding protein n=2 Tax=Paenibacillus donghaensis TaxID=414771 RepID=A0A2Z2KX29_9BACL|nr:penicillin-binding protein [Paenibacillus donghaensis]